MAFAPQAKAAARPAPRPRPKPISARESAPPVEGTLAPEAPPVSRAGPRPFPIGIVVAVVGVLVVLALLYFFVFAKPATPERVADEFLEAWKSNNIAKVTQLTASASKDAVTKAAGMVSLTEYQIAGDAMVEGDKAMVPIKFRISPELLKGPISENLPLVKEEGQWRVELIPKLQEAGPARSGAPPMPGMQPGPPGTVPIPRGPMPGGPAAPPVSPP